MLCLLFFNPGENLKIYPTFNQGGKNQVVRERPQPKKLTQGFLKMFKIYKITNF